MKPYATITEAGKIPEIGLSSSTIRSMVKRSEVPGFYSGNRFYIDTRLFIDELKERSIASLKMLSPENTNVEKLGV